MCSRNSEMVEHLERSENMRNENKKKNMNQIREKVMSHLKKAL